MISENGDDVPHTITVGTVSIGPRRVLRFAPGVTLGTVGRVRADLAALLTSATYHGTHLTPRRYRRHRASRPVRRDPALLTTADSAARVWPPRVRSSNRRSEGTDAAKKIVGRKRSIATDALGLLLAVIVVAASVTENKAGIAVLDQVKALHPTPCPGERGTRHPWSAGCVAV